ncbi:MAG TPA: FKBP-type peptidyl-prolyl cis-trans isomerase [Polyangiaceae bacterium]|nr:FKBP-type peptidyl-prolyl cis-trans isomerase [Polyangiaceae bacterium]
MHVSNARRCDSGSIIAPTLFGAACVIAIAALAGCKSEDSSAPAANPVARAAASASAAAAEPTRRPAPAMPEALPAPSDVAAPPKDAEKTADGVYSKVLQPGVGSEHPQPGDIEYINYAAWRKDGVMFDRNGRKPYSINLNQVIPGWAEGLRLMVAGEKRRLWIPAKLAFGDTPRPSGYAEAFGDVVIDVELVKLDTTNRKVALAPAARAPSSIARKAE